MRSPGGILIPGDPLHSAAPGQGSSSLPRDPRVPNTAGPHSGRTPFVPLKSPAATSGQAKKQHYSRVLQVLLQGRLHLSRRPPGPGSLTSSRPTAPQARSASRSHDPGRAQTWTAPPEGQTSPRQLLAMFGRVGSPPAARSHSLAARVTPAGGDVCSWAGVLVPAWHFVSATSAFGFPFSRFRNLRS